MRSRASKSKGTLDLDLYLREVDLALDKGFIAEIEGALTAAEKARDALAMDLAADAARANGLLS